MTRLARAKKTFCFVPECPFLAQPWDPIVSNFIQGSKGSTGNKQKKNMALNCLTKYISLSSNSVLSTPLSLSRSMALML